MKLTYFFIYFSFSSSFLKFNDSFLLFKVTKKSVTDFYFQLDKNVAFGAEGGASSKVELKDVKAETLTHNAPGFAAASGKDASKDIQSEVLTDIAKVAAESSNTAASVAVPDPVPATTENKQPSEELQIKQHFKRSGDALAAARERYLARKKAKEY